MGENLLYYGDNLDTLLGPAVLLNHRFIINARGVATIITSQSTRVYGLVSELSDEQIARMDRFEGVALGHYRRCGVLSRWARLWRTVILTLRQ